MDLRTVELGREEARGQLPGSRSGVRNAGRGSPAGDGSILLLSIPSSIVPSPRTSPSASRVVPLRRRKNRSCPSDGRPHVPAPSRHPPRLPSRPENFAPPLPPKSPMAAPQVTGERASHPGELGSVSTGDLLDPELGELGLELVKLLEKLVALLGDELGGANFVGGVRHSGGGRGRLGEKEGVFRRGRRGRIGGSARGGEGSYGQQFLTGNGLEAVDEGHEEQRRGPSSVLGPNSQNVVNLARESPSEGARPTLAPRMFTAAPRGKSRIGAVDLASPTDIVSLNFATRPSTQYARGGEIRRRTAPGRGQRGGARGPAWTLG